MSTTIVSVFVLLLSQILPFIGIDVGSEQLTDTISTLLAIGTGLFIWYRRVLRGDVAVSGVRK